MIVKPQRSCQRTWVNVESEITVNYFLFKLAMLQAVFLLRLKTFVCETFQ